MYYIVGAVARMVRVHLAHPCRWSMVDAAEVLPIGDRKKFGWTEEKRQEKDEKTPRETTTLGSMLGVVIQKVAVMTMVPASALVAVAALSCLAGCIVRLGRRRAYWLHRRRW